MNAIDWVAMRLLRAAAIHRSAASTKLERGWANFQMEEAREFLCYEQLEPLPYTRAHEALEKEIRNQCGRANFSAQEVQRVEAMLRTGIQRPETLPRLTPLNDEVWRTADGRTIPVSEMDADHARNALRMLLRAQRQKAFETYLASARRHREPFPEHWFDDRS